jgi:cytochrome P450
MTIKIFLGPKWKKHRRILTPAFHFQILEQFIDVFESGGNTLIQKLEKEVGKKSVDIYPFVTLCTLDIICGGFIDQFLARWFKIIIKTETQKVVIMIVIT